MVGWWKVNFHLKVKLVFGEPLEDLRNMLAMFCLIPGVH